MKGILDRMEDNNKAVILIEEQKEEIIVSRDELPEGSDVNTWFQMEEQEGKYHIVAIDEAMTKEKAQTTSSLMEKLRNKSKGSKFKKK
ncbi:DUF3006 family protein [Lentibacillus sediminis]|uniref:DUF3006 family protein n=1 Tax=Lentibacillus sediminis TaxID=1940529 RepID=UPI000C1BB7CD|nr:DUF3006 family protein [Lentibacillus sediminis]